jgi:hypothetical protein
MQSSKMDIRNTVLLLDNCTKFLHDYKITGYTEAIKPAEKLALQLNVELKFRVTRVIRRKSNLITNLKTRLQNPKTQSYISNSMYLITY